ncbi:MAG: nucleoside triphosphate pyrophosphohydrolase [Thermoanaerobaculia bacterium]
MSESTPPTLPTTTAATDLARLTALVARLRAPDGCPWDREQTLPDLRAYLLEEAHEVAAALDSGDRSELAGELGDLLFQVVFIARLVEESGGFTLGAAVDAVEAKMISRHPHVFAGETLAGAKAVREAWERRKVRTQEGERRSLLDGATSASLPALVAAYRLTQKAAGVGFDWSEAGEVVAKLDEEIAELKELLTPEASRAPLDSEPSQGFRTPAQSSPAAADLRQRRTEEIGDLLFTVANLARHLEIDPEGALAAANLKFRRRFAAVEAGLAGAGKNLAEATLEEMEAHWQAAKLDERRPG